MSLCFDRRPAAEQRSGIINVFLHSVQSKTKHAHWRDDPVSSYHGHHLQVLHVRPLGGQQLLGDEVGPVCGEPLGNEQNQENEKTETAQIEHAMQPMF